MGAGANGQRAVRQAEPCLEWLPRGAIRTPTVPCPERDAGAIRISANPARSSEENCQATHHEYFLKLFSFCCASQHT
jgi:hypothetical protein